MVDITVWDLTQSPLTPVILKNPANSLDEATGMLPGGAYTTFRTYHQLSVLRFSDHISRLEDSSFRVGQSIHINWETVRSALRMLLISKSTEQRVRMLVPLEQEIGKVYACLEPLHVPSCRDYQNGVSAITVQMQRENPLAKLSGFIEVASQVRSQLPADTNEALMIGEDGYVLEGLSSNIFSVMDGAIHTADEGVLHGITRQSILDVIRSAGIPLKMQPIHVDELSGVSEMFISSTSRSVLPVTRVNGQPVGGGLPGEVTRMVIRKFDDQLESQLEAI